MEERIETMENETLEVIEDTANDVEIVESCDEADNDVSFAFAMGVGAAIVGGIIYKKALKPGWKKAKAWIVEKLADKDEEEIINAEAEEVDDEEEYEEFFTEEIPDVMESNKKRK